MSNTELIQTIRNWIELNLIQPSLINGDSITGYENLHRFLDELESKIQYKEPTTQPEFKVGDKVILTLDVEIRTLYKSIGAAMVIDVSNDIDAPFVAKWSSLKTKS